MKASNNPVSRTTSVDTRSEILSILRGIDRTGIDAVIRYMTEGSDFFSARCHNHHRYRGGLADHSLDVYKRMMRSSNLSPESVAIVALFHDLGTSYGPDSALLHGHGRKSIAILENVCGFKLIPSERDAIRYHMHHHAHQTRNNRLAHAICWADSGSASSCPYSRVS